MAARKTTVSMKDVAALAGVSLGTVSNVLNSQVLLPSQRGASRARHRKAGLIPNEPARQLRAGRSRSIGTVVMDIANPFYTDLVPAPRIAYKNVAIQSSEIAHKRRIGKAPNCLC
jgi:LacI family transcriptional regulator